MTLKSLQEDWSDLEHAYGSAKDLPELIKQFESCPDSRTWDALWSRLCHQGTFYSATWWALPHLVEIVKNTSSPQEQELYIFLTSIEITRQVCKVILNEQEEVQRQIALKQAIALSDSYLQRHQDNADVMQSVLAFYAVIGKNAHLAEMLLMIPQSLENILDEVFDK